MFQDADTLVRDAGWSDDWIMHDLKSDAVDQIIWYDLSYPSVITALVAEGGYDVPFQPSPPLPGL